MLSRYGERWQSTHAQVLKRGACLVSTLTAQLPFPCEISPVFFLTTAASWSSPEWVLFCWFHVSLQNDCDNQLLTKQIVVCVLPSYIKPQVNAQSLHITTNTLMHFGGEGSLWWHLRKKSRISWEWNTLSGRKPSFHISLSLPETFLLSCHPIWCYCWYQMTKLRWRKAFVSVSAEVWPQSWQITGWDQNLPFFFNFKLFI